MELTEMCSKHAPKITSIKVEPIIRSGIQRFTDQTGKLWVLLADYYIRLGQFELVRAPWRRWRRAGGGGVNGVDD